MGMAGQLLKRYMLLLPSNHDSSNTNDFLQKKLKKQDAIPEASSYLETYLKISREFL